jgi:uncharacterized protein
MTTESKIQWRPWSRQAFDEAQKHDKPILLRLSAVWCHWCHVMDATSDQDNRAVQLLNDKFVPIRVDIDQMPDVRERYNFGGYPTSAFLTPGGDILTGGTYIPPDQFVDLLERVSAAYKEQKDDILQQLRDHEAQHAGHERGPAPAADDARELAETVWETTSASALVNFDPDHGGFGKQPKFPHSAATELALRAWQETGKKEYETIVRKTLEGMRNSALWDREEKAFFRYSVLRDWSEPHYEKMLETNAGLLANYAHAGAVLGRPDLVQVAKDSRDYLETVLRSKTTGLFHGSQDAHEEYYAMPLAQRKEHEAPYVDPTHYTDWNAQMIHAYFEAYAATGEPTWLREGLRALDALIRLLYVPSNGFLHHTRGDAPKVEGLFSDQAHAIRALLAGYELTGDAKYLDLAQATYATARANIWDDQRGSFRDKADRPDDLGLLRKPQSSIVDNGVMARNLVRLLAYAPRPEHEADLRRIFAAFAPLADRYGIFAAELGLAGLEWQRPLLQINVIGTPEQAGPLVRAASQVSHPNTVLRRFDPKTGAAAAQALGLSGVKAPSVFACVGTACSRLYGPGENFGKDLERLVKAAPRTA